MQQRQRMAGRGPFELVRPRVEDRKEQRDEPAAAADLGLFAQPLVDLRDELPRVMLAVVDRADERPQHQDRQARLEPVPAGIADEQHHPPIGQQEGVVVVAAGEHGPGHRQRARFGVDHPADAAAFVAGCHGVARWGRQFAGDERALQPADRLDLLLQPPQRRRGPLGTDRIDDAIEQRPNEEQKVAGVVADDIRPGPRSQKPGHAVHVARRQPDQHRNLRQRCPHRLERGERAVVVRMVDRHQHRVGLLAPGGRGQPAGHVDELIQIGLHVDPIAVDGQIQPQQIGLVAVVPVDEELQTARRGVGGRRGVGRGGSHRVAVLSVASGGRSPRSAGAGPADRRRLRAVCGDPRRRPGRHWTESARTCRRAAGRMTPRSGGGDAQRPR